MRFRHAWAMKKSYRFCFAFPVIGIQLKNGLDTILGVTFQPGFK